MSTRQLAPGEHLIFTDAGGNWHDHGPAGLWPCLEPYYEKKRSIEQAGGKVEMHKITVTISTALMGNSPSTAKQEVLDTLGDFTFGKPGELLPFQLEEIEVMPLTDEDIGRG